MNMGRGCSSWPENLKELKGKKTAISLAHTIRDQSHSSLGINATRKLDFIYFGISTILIIAFVFTVRT